MSLSLTPETKNTLTLGSENKNSALSTSAESKNTLTLTNESKQQTLETWDEATYTWDEALGTWDNQFMRTLENKIALNLTNETKL